MRNRGQSNLTPLGKKVVLGAGTALATAAVVAGLYGILKDDPQVANDKPRTTPARQETPKKDIPSYTRGMAQGRGE